MRYLFLGAADAHGKGPLLPRPRHSAYTGYLEKIGDVLGGRDRKAPYARGLHEVKWGRWETMAKRKTCGDCGTKEGQLHILGCDMERCPFCGNQLISCQCGYKKLGIDVSPGSWAYSHGLTEAQQEDWEKLLSDKGRIPFILYPNLCAKCGTLWPEMFVVLDAEWKHYIEPQMRREMLCEACYIQIKAWIDGEGLGLTRRRKQTKRPASRAGG